MGYQRGQVIEVRDAFQQIRENFQPGQFTRNVILHFIIEGEPWSVSLSPQSCSIVEGNGLQTADCTVEMSREIFLGAFNGTYKPSLMDLMSGRIKVDRPEMLFAFKDLFASF